MNVRLFSALAVLVTAPVFAQLTAPNSAGIAMGHVHINASDVEAQKRFWTEVGGTVIMREKLIMVQFPGAYVLIRKQDPTGGTVGSVMNHFGLYVKDFEAVATKWKAAKLDWEQESSSQGFLHGPDGIKLEIYLNKDLATPMAFHHVHLSVPDPPAAQKWYDDNFGATAGKRGKYDTSNVPGSEIAFAKAEKPEAPTKGRAVDHMGFEVKNLDTFVAKLQASGIKTDGAIRNSPNASGLRIVYITDPWGTQIELTEGMGTPVQSARASR